MTYNDNNPRRRRKTVLMVPVGAVAAALLLTSTAWACGALRGHMDLRGNRIGSPLAQVDGAGGHFASNSTAIVAARACVLPEAATNLIAPGKCSYDAAGDGFSYVEVATSANTTQLPPSANSFTYCTNNVPDLGATGRCAIGDATDPLDLDVPPVAVTNDIGDYWVNLVLGQWVDANVNGTYDGGPGDMEFDPDGPGGVFIPVPSASSERVSGLVASGCGNGVDQTARVVHLGLATIDTTGQISNASRPPETLDRAQADQYTPLVPEPNQLGTTKTWRFYFPATLPTAIDPTLPPAPLNTLVAHSVCVVDRYGTNSIEAPVQLMLL